MAEPIIFHFAIKPGCDPVYLPSLSAHARFPWVAQGYEVFEWRWLEDLRWVGMLKTEIDRLYAFYGVERTDPHVVSNAAQVVYDDVERIIHRQVDFHARRSELSWMG